MSKKIFIIVFLLGILSFAHALTNQDISRAIFRHLSDTKVRDPLTYHTLFDQKYDYDFTNKTTHSQTSIGGESYNPPFGWHRIALNVSNKYDNGDMAWLGKNNNDEEWPVSYHGTSFEAVVSIIQNGFDFTKTKMGSFGRGHYTAPIIKAAEFYSKPFHIEGKMIKLAIQTRVNPKTLTKVRYNPEYWLSTSDRDVRSYHLCWKEVS